MDNPFLKNAKIEFTSLVLEEQYTLDEVCQGNWLEPYVIKCVQIYHYPGDKNKDCIEINLRPDYSKEDFARFLNKLDFMYDSRGSFLENLDTLQGTVWFKDGTWAKFEEYQRPDGVSSYVWVYYSCPYIPDEFYESDPIKFGSHNK
jgi:hypothetical protein